MKHTEGPWGIGYGESPFLDNGHIIESGDKMIAHVEPWNGDPEQQEEANANAYLLADAPELKRHLEELIEYLGEDWQNDPVVEEKIAYLTELNKHI